MGTMKTKTPLFLGCSGLLILILLCGAGFILRHRFSKGSGSEDVPDYFYDEPARIPGGNGTDQHGGSSSGTLWDLHNHIKTKNTFKVYFFNVQNPEEVLEGKKPKLVEKGPYTYDETKTRVTIGIYPESDSVRYKDHLMYEFNEDQTPKELKLGDEVTVINLPWVGLAQEVSRLSSFSRFIVMAIVSRFGESVFMKRPVKEIMFDGFYHELISTLGSITGESYMPNNTFGFFYGRNNSFLDPREIKLGLKDPQTFGQVLHWKGKDSMDWWGDKKADDSYEEDGDSWFSTSIEDDDPDNKDTPSPKPKKEPHPCNRLGSADWSMFHPNLKKTEVLNVFDDKMCRNIKLHYKEEVDLKGVTGWRFVIPRSEYGDPKTYPENACYCTLKDEDEEPSCPLDGAYQISACSKGAAVLLSQPHFFQGDPSYVKGAQEGLDPQEGKHETYVDIEPLTGQVLRYSKRVQVNLHLKPLKQIKEFNEVPDMIFPVIWSEEQGVMKDEELVDLKNKVKNIKEDDKPLFKITSSLVIPNEIVGVKPAALGGSPYFNESSNSKYLMISLIGIVAIVTMFILISLRRIRRRESQISTSNNKNQGDEGEEFITITSN